MKGIYEKPTVSRKDGKLSKIKNKTIMLALTTPINIILEVLTFVIRQEEEIKEWIKTGLNSDNMIIYVENLIDFLRIKLNLYKLEKNN